MGLSKKTVKFLSKKCTRSLAGKTVLITGANSGVGYKTAEILIYLGARVIMACRSLEKASSAREKLLEEYPDADIRVMRLDIADFSSIDSFANELPDVDAFINNAGVFHRPGEKTKDGFEMVMGTNYMGVYYLGEKVLPKLERCGHDVVYINTISIIHKVAKVRFDRFFSEKGAYSRSKLCLARYSEYLARKYSGTNISVFMSHPGITITQIASHVFGRIYFLAKITPFNSTEKSSLSAAVILAGDVPEGSVVGPGKLFGGWGYPKVNKKCKRALRDIDPLIEFTQNAVEKANSGREEKTKAQVT
ncbi:MAG: SDR family NAD(P)-dependent oxidoreductase [Clostridia bacterium]|nr:SDR family NAD(P)-dependent oxidoreductase [Clostridia bacterium]